MYIDRPSHTGAVQVGIYVYKQTISHWSCTGGNMYKACPSEIGTEFGAPLFSAVELCDFTGRWQCMSGEIWNTLDRVSVLLTETEAR